MKNIVRVEYLEINELGDNGEVIDKIFCLHIFDEHTELFLEHSYTFEQLQEKVNLSNLIDYLHGLNQPFYQSVVRENGLYFNNKWYSLQELVSKLQENIM